jgi:integration host factor subunit alpha
MTKADIVKNIQDVTGMSAKDSANALETVFEIIKQTLASEENLKISGFGSFIVKQKQNRKGRNPQTGDAITITARRVLTFKPSSLLRSAINHYLPTEKTDNY